MSVRTLLSLAFLLATAAVALLSAGRHVETPPVARDRSTAAQIIHRIHATTDHAWSRSMDFEEAAKEHEARGDWVTALRLRWAWEPSDFCGLYLMSLFEEKRDRIVECLIRLRDYDGAARFYLACLAGESHDRPGEWSAHLILRLYEAAGQAKDIEGVLNALEHRIRSRYASWPDASKLSRNEILNPSNARWLLEVQSLHDMGRRRDANALIAQLREWRSPPGLAAMTGELIRVTAESLAECGAPAIPLAAAAAPDCPGAVLALGLMRSPSARQALQDLGPAAHPDDLAFAMALHGDAGRSVLRRWANSVTDPALRDAARRQLNTPLPAPWQPLNLRPAPGSLPRRLPVVSRER